MIYFLSSVTSSILTAMTMLAASELASKTMDEANLQNEMKRLQGTWRCVETEVGGRRVKADEIAEHRMVISGSECSLHSGKRVTTFSIRIDTEASPMHIDLKTKSTNETMHGIFRFEGPKLYINLDMDKQARPTEFPTAPGSKQVLRQFEKVDS